MNAVSVPVCEEAHMAGTWWRGCQVSSPRDWQGTKRKEGVEKATDKILFKSVMVSFVILTHSRVTWEESQ